MIDIKIISLTPEKHPDGNEKAEWTATAHRQTTNGLILDCAEPAMIYPSGKIVISTRYAGYAPISAVIEKKPFKLRQISVYESGMGDFMRGYNCYSEDFDGTDS